MKTLLVLSVLFLSACDNEGTGRLVDTPGKTMPEASGPSRFSVVYQGSFVAASKDRATYRAIYLVTDTTTGIQYLALEGCGTSQLVVESNGKVSRTVEQ